MSADDVRQVTNPYARHARETLLRALASLKEDGTISGYVSGGVDYTYPNGWGATVYPLGQGTIVYDGRERTGMDKETADVLRASENRVLILLEEVDGGVSRYLFQWLDVLDESTVGDARRTANGKELWLRDAFSDAGFPRTSTRFRFPPVGPAERRAWLALRGTRGGRRDRSPA